tara:strand:- start:1274 stop:2365 length:1092 start_codon:yes stop_codon:yes gene_type:complete
MIIREAKFKDYEKIKILTEKFNLTIFKKKEWEDIWLKNPYLKKTNSYWPIGWVIEDEDKIVGHISNIPTEYYYENKNYIGSIISCWVVEQKYRVHSIRLIKKFHDQEKRDFFIATTSNIKTVNTLRAFGWKKMPEKNFNSKLNIILNLKKILSASIKKKFNIKSNLILPLSYLLNFFMSYKLNRWKTLKLEKNFEILNNFNSDFDIFWKKLRIKKKEKFLFNRSSSWLDWHLNSKIKLKDLSIIVQKIDNIIIGYAITIYKNDKNLNIKKSVLIDLNVINDDNKIYKNMILAAIEKSLKDKCDLFQIVGFNQFKRNFMKEFKFFETKNKFSPFYFFTKNNELETNLEKRESWDPSEIDGDSVF